MANVVCMNSHIAWFNARALFINYKENVPTKWLWMSYYVHLCTEDDTNSDGYAPTDIYTKQVGFFGVYWIYFAVKKFQFVFRFVWL